MQAKTYYLTAGKTYRTRLVVWCDEAGVERREETADFWKLGRRLRADGYERVWEKGTVFSTYEGT
jgi:hypothetical protein